jgi:tetratricopeptide (TPR) repeat protein
MLKAQRFIPLLVIAAGIWAYHNSLQGVFLLDDNAGIVQNITIRRLWPVWKALTPPSRMTVEGRPLVNLSLAVNYAFGGVRVWGYHVLNLTIHILAGLTLLGIVARTLRQPALRDHFGRAALPLALTIALIWVVHPLQTESVTYVIQRAETLMGLFYLLTLYCAIRGADSASANIWYSASVVACLLGMASKEVMVSAPLIVLLYDRTFLSGTFAKAWRQRWRLYVGLAATWILLGYLVASTGNRSGSVGFGTNVTWQAYGLTQLRAIALYMKLSFWPEPLVFDYGTGLAHSFSEVVSSAFIVAVLLAGTLVALRRWPALGFVGAWFFVILAPTSSVMPVATQTMAEHRMYLPLAGVVALVVIGAFVFGKRLFSKQTGGVLACFSAGSVVLLFAHLSIQRNQTYNSELAIWSDTVAQCPDNSRAQNCLGEALLDAGKVLNAIGHYERAVQIQPDYAEAHNNLGNALMKEGRLREAIRQYEQALRIAPDLADAHYNLGVALEEAGRLQDAVEHYKETVRIEPDSADAHNNLGNALLQLGSVQEAIGHYEQALKIGPDSAGAHYNLGSALGRAGKLEEAIEQYRQALRINPDYAEAHCDLGVALEQAGRVQEALGHYEQALRIKPDYAKAQNAIVRLRARL